MSFLNVLLPCKSGDTIWQIRNKNHAKGASISKRYVTSITVFDENNFQIEHSGANPCHISTLGTEWFLDEKSAKDYFNKNIEV